MFIEPWPSAPLHEFAHDYVSGVYLVAHYYVTFIKTVVVLDFLTNGSVQKL